MLIANSCKSEYFTSQDSYTMSVMKQFKFLLPWNGYSLAPLNIQPFCITGTIWSRDGCLWGVLLYFDNWESDKYLLLDIIFIILISYLMQGTWMKIMVNMFATRLQSQTADDNFTHKQGKWTYICGEYNSSNRGNFTYQLSCDVTDPQTHQRSAKSAADVPIDWHEEIKPLKYTRICKHIIERFWEHCKYTYSIYSNGPEDAKCAVEGCQ